MSLTTPSKIQELQIKLYREAKNELPVQSRGICQFSDETVFGELGVLRLRDIQWNLRSWV
jgi:hypothetical protein